MKPIQLPFAAKQKGASFMGWLLVIILLVFFASIAFKMVPHYMDYKSIQKSIESFENAPPASVKTPKAFYSHIQKAMEINAIRNLKAEDIMKVERKGKKLIIQVDYERQEKVIKNLLLTAHFEKEYSVNIP